MACPRSSERLEPFKNGGIRAPTGQRRIDVTEGLRFGNRSTLHVEIHCGVAVGSLDTDVSEPMADGDQIDAGWSRWVAVVCRSRCG